MNWQCTAPSKESHSTWNTLVICEIVAEFRRSSLESANLRAVASKSNGKITKLSFPSKNIPTNAGLLSLLVDSAATKCSYPLSSTLGQHLQLHFPRRFVSIAIAAFFTLVFPGASNLGPGLKAVRTAGLAASSHMPLVSSGKLKHGKGRNRAEPSGPRSGCEIERLTRSNREEICPHREETKTNS